MTSSAKGLILTGIRQEAWLWSSNSYQEPGEDRSRISVSVLDEGGGGGGAAHGVVEPRLVMRFCLAGMD